jgi:hypothetical protein
VSYLFECDISVGLHNVRFEVLTLVTVTMTSVILRRIDTSVYAGGDHNPAREPHVALARHWWVCRKIPLIIFGYWDYNIVCEISSSHGGEYDVQSFLLGYTAV